MPITDTVKTCSYMVAGKWKAFCMKTRIPGPNIISAPTNILVLHYGLILIQLGNKVIATSFIATSSTATSSVVTATNSIGTFCHY